jgi:ribonucleotide monophosphatase NagD (HAD superfamily)
MNRCPSLNDWLEHSAAIEALLLDIDGVLLSTRRRLPGSRALVKLLNTVGLPYLLITNDGNHSIEEKSSRLQAAGLPIGRDHIVSCGHAIAHAGTSRRAGAAKRFFAMGDTGNPVLCQSCRASGHPRICSGLTQCAGSHHRGRTL